MKGDKKSLPRSFLDRKSVQLAVGEKKIANDITGGKGPREKKRDYWRKYPIRWERPPARKVPLKSVRMEIQGKKACHKGAGSDKEGRIY